MRGGAFLAVCCALTAAVALSGCGGGSDVAELVAEQDGTTADATVCEEAGAMAFLGEREPVFECRTLEKIVRCFVVVDGEAHDVSARRGEVEPDPGRTLTCEPAPFGDTAS